MGMLDMQGYEGMSGIYERHRAGYPQTLMKKFVAAVRLPDNGGLVVDVGAGTGIATRLLRALIPADVAILGIEPGDAMRETAVAQSQNLPNLAFLKAPAEALPLNDAAVDAILVAQAIHWFDRPKFYAEALRVLKPAGVLGITQNNRDWRASPFLDAYEGILEEYGNHYRRDYRSFDLRHELEEQAGLVKVESHSADHILRLDQADFVPWSFSSTKMQDCLRHAGEKVMRAQINLLLQKFFDGAEQVPILYVTELFLGYKT